MANVNTIISNVSLDGAGISFWSGWQLSGAKIHQQQSCYNLTVSHALVCL